MKSIILLALMLLGEINFAHPLLQENTGASGIEPEMVLVEGGTFNMGRVNGLNNEMPLHAVTLNSFYIGI